jgi:hypothetical protein
MKRLLQVLVLFTSFLCSLFGQNIQSTLQETNISAGAEYSQLLQKMIRTGNAHEFKFNGILAKPTEQNGINVITTIEGINFDEDAANSGFYHIPPDPIGAAGSSHLVSVVNTSIEWFTKAGGNEHSESLANFFSSQTPLTGTFDPKVIYDQYNGRFVVVTLEQTSVAGGDPSNTSRILIAVSQTSDPNAGWYFTSINSAVTITSLCWADYPGFAVTDDAILVTCNMFSFNANSFQGSRLWIIQKSPFYTTGTGAVVNIYDPSTLDGDPITNNNFTMQPAHMFGTLPTGVKSYLVATGYSAGSIDYFSVITIGGTSSSPMFSNTFVSLISDIHNTGVVFPEAPQLGTSTLINTPVNRVMNAVCRNNNLWAANTVNPPTGVDAGQATAHWYRMSIPLTSPVSDQGNIGGEDIATGTHTYYPSIAVNSSGDAIIGFSASAPTIYLGAYYAGRYSTTPAGTVLASQIFKPGLDYYIRTFGSGRNRWGDYSGSSVDPSDDQTFYVFNEYALVRGTPLSGEDGRWGTAFGVVPVSALPVELSSFTAKVLRTGEVRLDWRTETEVSNYGFEIEKLQDWDKIGFIEGNGNSNSPKDYSFTDLNTQYGSYAYRLKQIDTDGQIEYSNIIEVDAGNIPDEIVLEQNYPNPFNPATTIKFALAETQSVKLIVYDVLCNEVAVPFNGTAEGGKIYDAEFDGVDLSSGIYFYRLEAKNRTMNKKMLLLK